MGTPIASLREWFLRLWGTLLRRRSDDDLEEELRLHLELAEEEAKRRGESPRDARIKAGGVTQAMESIRDQRGFSWLDSFGLDVRLGLRMMRKSWGLTLVGGLAMTVAIGPGAIIFSLIETAVWRPLPLEEGDRVVAIQTWDTATNRRVDTAMPDFERWRDTLRSVEDIGAFQTTARDLAAEVADDRAEAVLVAEITPSGFRMARVNPLMGRSLREEDARAGADPVVVIGHDVWQSRFAADPAVVGREVLLSGKRHTVVGVMPPDFAFPVNHRLWVPLRAEGADDLMAGPNGSVFARLVPGASLESAQAELNTLGLLPRVTDRGTAGVQADNLRQPLVAPYILAFTDDVQGGGELALLFSIPLLIASLLLIPPCANTAILIYARTVRRQEEFAARHALGASRGRIVGQLFVEVLVLAAAAAGVALFLVPIAGRHAEAFFRENLSGYGGLPFWWDFSLSWATVLFAGGLAIFAAAVAGLIPALQATGRLLRSRFRSLGQGTSVPLGPLWTAMVVVQVTLCLAVVPTAAEVAWGTLRPGILGPGFAPEEFLTARLTANPGDNPETASDQRDFVSRFRTVQTEVVRRVETEPGVFSAVTAAAALPGDEPYAVVEIADGSDVPRLIQRRTFRFNVVDTVFFDVFDARLLAGRMFRAEDFGPTRTSVIVDQTFVDHAVGTASPLGRRVRLAGAPGSDEGPLYEIVGVVSDLPENTSHGRLYFPATSTAPAAPGLSLAVRVGPTDDDVAARLREIVAEVSPTVQVEIRFLDEVYRSQQGIRNLGATALAIVMLSVLLLSVGALYSLMSFTVDRRRREIGIRTALGGQSWRLLAGIFGRALAQVGIGAGIGVLGAALLHRVLNVEMLGGWHLPGVLPAAAAVMIAIGLLAAILPARRALRVSPVETLGDGG